ncbi:MAG: hypothetical protein AAF518_20360 [Spirochaetota bacterium]
MIYLDPKLAISKFLLALSKPQLQAEDTDTVLSEEKQKKDYPNKPKPKT